MARLSASQQSCYRDAATDNSRDGDTSMEGAAQQITAQLVTAAAATDVSAASTEPAAAAQPPAAASAALCLLDECRSLLSGLLHTRTLSLALSPSTATPSSSSSFSAQHQQQQQLLQRKALRSLLLQCLPHCGPLFSEAGQAGG